MTTLGALSVGLLVLVLVVAAGIALLARSQRRAPRGPEQPRTVADLVRMRAERDSAGIAGAAASTDVAPTPESSEGIATVAPASPAEPQADASPLEAEEPSRVTSAGSPADSEPTTELATPVAAGPAPTSEARDSPETSAEPVGSEAAEAPQPGPGAAPSGSLQDTPWARAARMADPLAEWTASARAARERAETSGPRPRPHEVPRAQTPAEGLVVVPPPRLSLLDPDRAALDHDTTTIAHLPKGFAPTPPASEQPEAADQAASEQAAACRRDDDETVQFGGPPGAGAAAAQGPDVPDDSLTVDFAHPMPGGPAESAGPAGAADTPEEPTGPVEPTAFATFGTAHGHSTIAVAPPPTVLLPTPARVAGRVRRSPADTAAEQAAADLALLRTFGVAGPGHAAAAQDTEFELEGCSPNGAEPSAGVDQPVAFRVVGRDGRGLAGASVTLLDDHGREISGTAVDEHGAGSLTARRPGGYMLVTAADGYQPGALTIVVADGPVDTEIPLTRSASIAGSVCGEDGPIVGAHLVLVQDGEIVDTADSGVDGAYVFADLAAGEYGLSVSASECEPSAAVLRLVDEADLRFDVDLDPVGLPAGGAGDDVMIGHL